jgi:methylmalonyl-CoA mutase
VRRGELPQSIPQSLALLGELAYWTHERRPRSRSVTVCTSAYHEGGASPGLDVALAVETGSLYLRAMVDRGLSPTAAAGQISFSFSIGVDVMLAAAKLRAFRRLWEDRAVALGVEPNRRAFVHARTSRRVLTTRDAYMNMVRDSACCAAAALAGADAFTGEPLDSACGVPSTFAHRASRSMQHVLRTECNLSSPDGAAAREGSDGLLREVMDAAREETALLSEAGGIVTAIKEGLVLSRIATSHVRRAREMAVGVRAVAGVSAFAEVDGPKAVPSMVDLEVLRRESALRLADWRVAHPAAGTALQRLREQARRFEQPGSEPGLLMETAVRAAVAGATVGQISAALLVGAEVEAAPVVVLHPYAEAFERLRDAADQLVARTGVRPLAVVVRAVGSAADASRAAFAQGLLEAGGFEVVWTRAGADAEEIGRTIRMRSAGVVVFCAESDALQKSLEHELAEQGCAVVRCTRPTSQPLSGAGLRIHPGCDAVAVLLVLLRMCGASL